MYRRLVNWLAEVWSDPREQRRSPRIQEPRVVVYYWDGSTPSGRQLRDINMTGAYLYTSERWYPGTIVRLLIQGMDAPAGRACAEDDADAEVKSAPGGSVSIPARVVRHGSDGVALEFVFRGPADQKLLEQLIAKSPKQHVLAQPSSQGQAMIEFTLIFPLLFLLIVNAVNFGVFIFDWITVAGAARSATQYWVLGSASPGAPTPATSAQVTTLVTNDISSLLNRSSLVVRVCTNNNGTVTCTGSGTNTPPADPEPLTYTSATVDVTYTFRPPIPLFTFSNLGIHATLPPTTIHRRSVMRVLN